MIRLQQMRLDRRLTVTDVSDSTGVARKTIARLERTGMAGSPDPLHDLAEFFGCKPSDLLAPAVFSASLDDAA